MINRGESAIPLAIDFLVAAFRELEVVKAGIDGIPVIVEDGFPTQRSNLGIAVGIVPGNSPTDDEVSEAALGGNMQEERFSIPCIIWATVGGADAKTPRDRAFALFNAILKRIRTTAPEASAGRTLGGALSSNFASIARFSMTQTNVTVEAAEGRACEIVFYVEASNRM